MTAAVAILAFMALSSVLAVPFQGDESDAGMTTTTVYGLTFVEPQEQTLYDVDEVKSADIRVVYNANYWWIDICNADTYYDGVMMKIHNNPGDGPGSSATSFFYNGILTEQFNDSTWRSATGMFGMVEGRKYIEVYMVNEGTLSNGNTGLLNTPADGSNTIVFEFNIGATTTYHYTTSVSYDVNGGSGSITDTIRNDDRDSETTEAVSLNITSSVPTAPDGMEFAGWSMTSTGDIITASSVSVKIGEEITLYAIYTISQVSVTFHSNGTVYDTVSIDKGTAVAVPEAPADTATHRFAGWYTDETYGTPFDFAQTVDADTDVYAYWVERLEFTSQPSSEYNVQKVAGTTNTFVFSLVNPETVSSVSWDFGNGVVDNRTAFTKTLEPGTYSILLTVSNSLGSETETIDLTVEGESDDGRGWMWMVVAAMIAVIAVIIVARMVL